MSLPKQRAWSANRVLHVPNNNTKPPRRYERIQTEHSQSLHQESSIKIKANVKQQSMKMSGYPLKATYKQPEQVFEENMNLKVFINSLQEQLSLQRGKLEMTEKKTYKYVKQLNRQFQKEMYYTGKTHNTYMFSGIKQQYENMKQLYEEKCKETNEILKSIKFTNCEELQTQIQILLADNKRLKQRLEIYRELKDEYTPSVSSKNFKKQGKRKINKSNGFSQIEKIYTQYSEEQPSSSEYPQNSEVESLMGRLAEQKNNYKQAYEVIKRYEQKNFQLSKELAQKSKKIVFLEKILIGKSNSEQQARRKAKKIEKGKLGLEVEIEKMRQELKTMEGRFNHDLQRRAKRQVAKFQTERDIFISALLDKDNKIEKLEKEIRYLSTLLSYWKPLDQINREYNREIYDQRQVAKDQSVRIQKISQSFKLKEDNPKKHETIQSDQLLVGLEIYRDNEHDKTIKSNKDEDNIKKLAGPRSQSQQNGDISNHNMSFASIGGKRVPQSCSKKHNESALKVRKVDINDIAKYGELLRYRLIGYQFNINKVKELFDVDEDSISEQQLKFKTEYINMNEIMEILQQLPFKLKKDEASLVSRYIVQDSANQYVYCDPGNQISRNIAKSIIKTFIGDYQISNEEQMAKEWQNLTKIYLLNLQLALKSIAPKGIISDAKFIELMTGLGIELNENLQDWIIGEMVIQSASLQELNYRVLIPQ